jgi:hypothetical protein
MRSSVRCDKVGAFEYAMGEEPPTEAALGPCGGEIEGTVLTGWARLEHRISFDLCSKHREFFDLEGRVAARGYAALPSVVLPGAGEA